MQYNEKFDVSTLKDTSPSSVLSPEDSVKAKYNDMYTMVYKVAADKSLYHHVLIAGDAGTGKSYTVEKAVEKGAAESHRKAKTFHGSIGKAVSDIIAFLYQYRDDYILVLDDCDDFLLGDQAIMNLFKAALDPSGHSVTISDTMRVKVASKLAESANYDENLQTLEETQGWEGLRDIFNTDYGDDEIVSDVSTAVETPEEKKEVEKAYKDTKVKAAKTTDDGSLSQLPDSFNFNSSIVMISNLRPEQIDNAFKSRCAIYVISLTHQEFALRLAQIKDGLVTKGLKNEPMWKVTWAKNCVVDLLIQVINLEGKTLFGKPVVIRQPLELRQITTRTQDWLDLTEAYTKDMKGDTPPAQNILDAIENKVAAQFVENYILPHL